MLKWPIKAAVPGSFPALDRYLDKIIFALLFRVQILDRDCKLPPLGCLLLCSI